MLCVVDGAWVGDIPFIRPSEYTLHEHVGNLSSDDRLPVGRPVRLTLL